MSDKRWEAGIFSGGGEAMDETRFWQMRVYFLLPLTYRIRILADFRDCPDYHCTGISWQTDFLKRGVP
jgi:hypothetical protein